MSLEQREQITKVLLEQGLSSDDIICLLTSDYECYESEEDIKNVFGCFTRHINILMKLYDGYTMDELESQGISEGEIASFQQMLSKNNVSIEEVRAFYEYSILGVPSDISEEKILYELEDSLQKRGLREDEIEKMKQFVQTFDYDTTVLHCIYDVANQYMKKIELDKTCFVSLRSALHSMYRCRHMNDTITTLNRCLTSKNMSKSVKLYRAVKGSTLVSDGEPLSSLVGQVIHQLDFTSTSLLYGSSFAMFYDCVLELYTPRGSRGMCIVEMSAYDKIEYEVLLNPNDIFVIDVKKDILEAGSEKTVLVGLCLSHNQECYRGINQKRGVTHRNGLFKFFKSRR